MTSRHQYTRSGAETAQERTVKLEANRPNRIDTSGRALSSNVRNNARVQPQLLSTQELDVVNARLRTAGESMELSRQKLFETRYVASSALQELEHEKQVHQRCSSSFKELQIQYGKNVTELHDVTSKCVSLHIELEEVHNKLSEHESASEESKKHGDWARERINVLEKEREDMMQEHREAISMRIAREVLAEQKITELQEGVDKLIREHEARMKITVERMNAAEQKVVEFSMTMGAPADGEMAPTTFTLSREQSLGPLKRPRTETKQERGRPSKHRRCKEATRVGEEDMRMVQN